MPMNPLKMAQDEPESPDEQQREAADPGAEAAEEPSAAGQAGSGDPSVPVDGGGGGQSQPELDDKTVALIQLLASRTLDALSKVSKELDAALKADPLSAGVKFGVQALRSVVMAAQEAGKDLPFQVIVNAGVAVILQIADIAHAKGYLPDDQVETFLNEAFQQSVAEYAKLDRKDGMLSDDDMATLQRASGGDQPAPPQQPGGALTRG